MAGKRGGNTKGAKKNCGKNGSAKKSIADWMKEMKPLKVVLHRVKIPDDVLAEYNKGMEPIIDDENGYSIENAGIPSTSSAEPMNNEGVEISFRAFYALKSRFVLIEIEKNVPFSKRKVPLLRMKMIRMTQSTRIWVLWTLNFHLQVLWKTTKIRSRKMISVHSIWTVSGIPVRDPSKRMTMHFYR